jgi:hypothetical protein
MYGELGAIKGIVDLSPEHALDEAEAFLASQGYSILRRTSTTLTAERRSSEESAGEAVPNLTVVVMPQPEGGVQIKIRGNDFEGVQARQTEWMGWSESLPRKAEGEAGALPEEQGSIQTPEIELPPPPTVESPTLPAPAPAADVPVPRWARIAADLALRPGADLLEGNREHVVQDVGEPLCGGKRLEHDEQREADGVG